MELPQKSCNVCAKQTPGHQDIIGNVTKTIYPLTARTDSNVLPQHRHHTHDLPLPHGPSEVWNQRLQLASPSLPTPGFLATAIISLPFCHSRY